MISIIDVKVLAGQEIMLPDTWHCKMQELLKIKRLPIEYVVKMQDFRHRWILQSKDNKYLIALTTIAVKYLLGHKEITSNTGWTFAEKLPEEGSELIITPLFEDNKALVGRLELESYIYKDTCTFDFKLVDICDNKKIEIDYAAYYSWKELDSKDTSYMSDIEKLMQDTFLHKKYVMIACDKMATYLEKHGIFHHAALLRERAVIHDNSKFDSSIERRAFSAIINDKSCMGNFNEQLSKLKIESIKLHWKHNSHHPEFYDNPEDMTRLDIMEMVCDWYARSLQYNNDLLDFAYTKQENRFHFPEYMFNEVIYYCKILLES